MSTPSQRVVDGYAVANVNAALVVIANPAIYPPDSLMGQWAALVLVRKKEAESKWELAA